MSGTLPRLAGLMGAHKGWLALAILLGFATVAAGVGLMATAAYVISSTALHPSVADLAVAIVGVRFFGIARGVFRYLERYVSHRATFRLLAELRVWFYKSVEPLAPAGLQPDRTGDLLARVVSDVETLQQFYLRVLFPPVVAALVALAMWFFFAAFDVRLGMALLAFLLVGGLVLPLFGRWLGAPAGRRLAAVRGRLGAQVADGIQGLADLTVNGQEGAYLAGLRSSIGELATAEKHLARLAGLQGGLAHLSSYLGVWAVLVLAIPLVSSGRVDGVYLAVLALAALAAFEAVLPLPQAFAYLEQSLAAAGRLFSIVDRGARLRPEAVTASALLTPRENEASGSELPALAVSHLRFRYGPDEPWALDGLSFNVSRGGHLAVVGPSGAGKSSVVNLLLRFWEYEEGSISLEGTDLRALSPDDARAQVALVSQRTYLFNTSVRQNLLLARPDAGEEEMEGASRWAQLHDFVTTLPRGYDTVVGEQGVRLSGGERQRVAVARALLKDAPLLVLDEATANLDSLTEQAILRSLAELRRSRTTLTITHRLVGLEEADEIIVLDAGRVAERGRHADLLAGGGLYRRMWDLQRQSLPEEWR